MDFLLYNRFLNTMTTRMTLTLKNMKFMRTAMILQSGEEKEHGMDGYIAIQTSSA